MRLPSFVNEPIVDYLMRVLMEARSTGRDVECEFGTTRFRVQPQMTTTQVARVWYESSGGDDRMNAQRA